MVVVKDHQNRSHPWTRLAPSGSISRSMFSSSTGLTEPGKSFCADGCAGARSQAFADLPPCIVGIEACGTAHFWAREIARCGHDVRLMPPGYVKPYVKRNKHDAADAEAVLSRSRSMYGRPWVTVL